MNEVVQVISTVGFPIVACIAMALFFKYMVDKSREERTEMNKMHKEEIDKLTQQHRDESKAITDALNNNTLALQKLCDKLGG